MMVFQLPGTAWSAERPNIVWLLSEDNSIHYARLYGDELGAMPNIESLAQSGLVFNHAFSCSPVCSVARTTLMTGMYAPRIGFQYHRKQVQARLPAGSAMFPVHLRKAGYYVSNNVKTDYNVVAGKVWNESSRKASWRNRPDKEMPFFHMQSFGMSHESSLHFKRPQMNVEELTTRPEDVTVFPYHPDTPTFRYTYARYHDRMRVVDQAIGRVIDQLREDGLMENTFVFYFGDHGGVLPRSKGYIYESGLHVPMVVHIPQEYRQLVSQQPGTRQDGFVEFVDFAPTVLNLAGLIFRTQWMALPSWAPPSRWRRSKNGTKHLGMPTVLTRNMISVAACARGNTSTFAITTAIIPTACRTTIATACWRLPSGESFPAPVS
jgi:uncharacterized sulfatase